MRITLTVAACLFLAACSTPEQQAARVAHQGAADSAECTRLGFTPKTDAFANCLLKLREIRAQEKNTRALQRNYRSSPFWGSPFHHHPYYY